MKGGLVNIVMKKLASAIVLIMVYVKMARAIATLASREKNVNFLSVLISVIIMEYVTKTDDVVVSLVTKETHAQNYKCCMVKSMSMGK
jgi:hypothetical protein